LCFYLERSESFNKLAALPASIQTQNIPMDDAQLLLKGCMLKNTKFVFGLVVFTG
jgi:hypothetical protein